MRKILLLFLFSFICLTASATVFTVTSNADSGPGTLRQALLDATANGTTGLDYIYFNIADMSVAGRTITLSTALPDVTGNIIIDGTTQPGVNLGVSNAKITITTAGITPNISGFNVSQLVNQADAVEFYGLYIKDLSLNTLSYGNGIVINTSCKLVIGAAGKGNVIAGVFTAIKGALKNAVIQANFIGLTPDGITEKQNQAAIANSDYCDNLLIGGPNPQDGNVIVDSYYYAIDIYHDGSQVPITVNITNNFFGTDYTGTHVAGTAWTGAHIYANAYLTTINVTKNVFAANGTGISWFNQATANIKGNFFGTDRSGTIDLVLPGHTGQAFLISGFSKGTMGSTDPQDQNIVANYGSVFMKDNTSTLEVIKNSFRCNQLVAMQGYSIVNYISNYLRIINLTDNYVSGDAPPGASVQLYFVTTICNGYCNPDTWFATVTANSSGIWEYNGVLPYPVMATSTLSHDTYGTEPFYIAQSDVILKNIDCHHPGSIALKEQRSGKFTFVWKGPNNNILPVTDQSLTNITTPGSYTLEISENGSCPTAIGQFGITDQRPHISPATYQLDCTHPTVDLTVYLNESGVFGISAYHWQDKDGNEISTQSVYKNAGVGVYYVYVTDSNGCNSETVKYEVLPAINAPVIDETALSITGADCGTSDGSIKGIKLSGTAPGLYGWVNATNNVTTYSQYDLLNAAAGNYYFFANYATNCTVKSSVFTIGSTNGITMDETSAAQTPISCAGDPGTVTGIKITGATTYQWFNNAGKVVGNTANLSTTAPGNFRLVVSNANGCNVTSQVYTIMQQTNADAYGGLSKILKDATCGLNNGSIQVLFTDNPTMLPKSYRWVNHITGLTVATTISPVLTGIDAGAYDIYVTNNTGCERLLINYSIGRTPGLTVVSSTVKVTDDNCGTGTGSITGIGASGKAPVNFTWTDINGNNVGASADLLNVKAGKYNIKIIDGSGCEQDLSYTINDQTSALATPAVTNLQLCGSGDALLTVNNPSSLYTYRLYDTYTNEVPIDEETSGRFKINVKQGRSYYITQAIGECESIRVEVKVTVGVSAVNIANTFSPNGDGINDTWNISNIQNYPNANVQIFTRGGQKLFESIGYSVAFDGDYNGKALPVGTYYYIINLNSGCGLLSGSLTIIR